MRIAILLALTAATATAELVPLGDIKFTTPMQTGAVVVAESDPIALALIATGKVSRAEAASILIGETGLTWLEVSGGKTYIVQVTNSSSSVYVSSTSGAGYNGPIIGTTWASYTTTTGETWYWDWGTQGEWALLGYDETKTAPNRLSGSTAYWDHALIGTDGPWEFLPDSAGDGVGTFVIAWSPITNVYEVATVDAALMLLSQREAAMTNAVHDIATSLIGAPLVLQGSVVVPTTNYTATLGGIATTNANGTVAVIPYQATRPSEVGSTGTVQIATAPDSYIVSVSGDMYVSSITSASLPMNHYPVEYSLSRVDDTNWLLSAWCPGDISTYPSANGYFATLSNLVVYTYDRPGYRPNTMTNDTAALPTFADAVPLSSAQSRRLVPAGSIRDYVDSRKLEFAKHAWRTTPSGGMSPDPNIVTIDQPLVQQGSIAYLQSGDYFVFYYVGGDWRQTETGSKWMIGASGREDFSITSDSRLANVRNFLVVGDVAYIYAATNWMAAAASTGLPEDAPVWVERSYDLVASQWLECPDCTATYHVDAVNGDYWLFTAPATADRTFYRIKIGGGLRRINSMLTHEFYNGIRFDGWDATYGIMTITNAGEVMEVVGRRVP